ncbi:MAG: DUF4373 domain-containing protein [Sporolactobacillus sp.]
MKDAYYFSHDSNARNDTKILALRTVYGMAGYGMYWVTVEMLREQDGYKLKKGKYVFDALAMQMQCERNAAEEFVEKCINEFDLLQEDDEFIWSESLVNRMENKDKKSEKARQSAKKRWKKSSNDADLMHSHSERNAPSNADENSLQSDSKALEERKVKESNKRSRRANKFDDKQMNLAKKLLDLIKQNNPNYKSPKSLDGWANEIRLMMEQDDRTHEQIDYLIEWSQQDSFWSTNCLSVRSLREHFDQMVAKCKQQKTPQQQRPRPEDGDVPDYEESMITLYGENWREERNRIANSS